MAGGIQVGTEAGSVESKQLDGDVRLVAEAIARAQDQYYYERGHRNLLNERFGRDVRDQASLPEATARGITIGCVPDGGMWFDGDRTKERKLVAVFEAKHQQNGGNAIERWATNHAVCQAINPAVVYTTFATGAGAAEGGVVHGYGESMRAIYPNTQWHYKPEGFSQEEICEIMVKNLGLDLTFEQVKPHIGFVIANNYDDLFVRLSPEEILADVASKQEVNAADDAFVELLKHADNPLAQAWRRVPTSERSDAKEIIIDMLTNQAKPATIAKEILSIYAE